MNTMNSNKQLVNETIYSFGKQNIANEHLLLEKTQKHVNNVRKYQFDGSVSPN